MNHKYQIIKNVIKNIKEHIQEFYKHVDKRCLSIILFIYITCFVYIYNSGFRKLYLSWKKIDLSSMYISAEGFPKKILW